MGQGQHFNQAAYIGKYYGITNNETNKFRNANITIIKIKDLIELNKSNQIK